MNTLLTEIDKKGEASGGELLRAARQITKNCRQHTNELFVEVKDNFGNVVEIMRDNNIEERSHRWSRMHIRRRNGRTRTTNEMAQYGALTAIFSNIENETYIKEIFPNVKDFIREIQDITPEEIQRSRKLIRPYTCKEMIHSDNKRSNILKEFIDLLEDGYSVENWLSKLNISNPIMTHRFKSISFSEHTHLLTHLTSVYTYLINRPLIPWMPRTLQSSPGFVTAR